MARKIAYIPSFSQVQFFQFHVVGFKHLRGGRTFEWDRITQSASFSELRGAVIAP